jgi:hypothetical protein
MSDERPRRLRWGVPDAPPPKHPYRDTLIVYGGMAIAVVLFAWATGGNVKKAIVIAVAVWIAASAWSIARWHQRLRRQAREDDAV